MITYYTPMTNNVIEELPRVEVYRTEEMNGYSNPVLFRWIVFTIEQCGQIPVVRQKGKETIIYAVKPSALRKEKIRSSLKKVESK